MSDPIPMLDLKAQFAPMRDEVLAAVARVFDAQAFIGGPELAAFEEEAGAWIGTHAIGASSGSDALLVALLAAGVGPGDEVVVPAFTFFATAGAVPLTGATPVFCDVDERSFNMTGKTLEAAVTPKTKAVIPVHLYGQCCDMDEINAVAEDHGLFVIEDACQAIGAKWQGRMAGTMGNCGAFSFFPSKNLGGAGDGGLLTATDADLADKLGLLVNHGGRSQYDQEMVGKNARLDALQAAVLRVKLPHLEGWAAARRANASRYGELLADVDGIALPTEEQGAHHVYNQFTVRVAEDRDAVKERLDAERIGSAVYYPCTLPALACFEGLGHRPGDFPVAEQACREVLSLPVSPELTLDQQERIADALADAVGAAV